MPPSHRVDWIVLLIGGPSGVGKSTAAKQIARRCGVPWLQVDELRLALQWSRVRLPDPEDTRKLYSFDAPNVWISASRRLTSCGLRPNDLVLELAVQAVRIEVAEFPRTTVVDRTTFE
jgi:cytidylate kinase